MPAAKTGTPRARKRTAAGSGAPDLLFDYRTVARAENISAATLQSLESEAAREFPNDPMLMELHVLRAAKAQGKRRRGDRK